MKCDEVRSRLIELGEGGLDEAGAAECRAHVAACPACARELRDHERTWELLGVLDQVEPPLGAERLERMAEVALREAARDGGRAADDESREPSGAADRATPVLALPRRWARWRRVAAAAVLVFGVTLATRLVLRGGGAGGGGPGPAPECLSDPEFLTNFDVIRDLRELDLDGDLLDVADDVLLLQALEGA